MRKGSIQTPAEFRWLIQEAVSKARGAGIKNDEIVEILSEFARFADLRG